MKNSVIILAFGFVFFCAGITVLAIQLILHDCLWWECAPERNFRISDLELPSTLFPDGAIVGHIRPMSDEYQTIEDGMQSIYWDNGNGNAGIDIYRYSTTKKAVDDFEFNKHLLVNNETGEVWKPPAEVTFSSRTADIVYVACGYWTSKECAMVARYQEYVVVFIAMIDEKMTYSEFEKILVFIDQQVSKRIYR